MTTADANTFYDGRFSFGINGGGTGVTVTDVDGNHVVLSAPPVAENFAFTFDCVCRNIAVDDVVIFFGWQITLSAP